MKEILLIEIYGREGVVVFGKKKATVALNRQPILAVISELVPRLKEIGAIALQIKGATFSGTRQVMATVNTLAWVLGVKVNGKKQMRAKYSGEPNVAKPVGLFLKE